jgi:hypothetical protein
MNKRIKCPCQYGNTDRGGGNGDGLRGVSLSIPILPRKIIKIKQNMDIRGDGG